MVNRKEKRRIQAYTKGLTAKKRKMEQLHSKYQEAYNEYKQVYDEMIEYIAELEKKYDHGLV